MNEASSTSVSPQGDRELLITRVFDAPPTMVFKAWSDAGLFRRWWMPKSLEGASIVSCELDVRTGGKYRLEFGSDGPDTMTFFGKYLEVVPNERIVWTNDEDEAEGAITTVTFEEQGGKTLLTFHELYASKEARDEALQTNAAALPEQLEQLAQMLSDANR